jgi:replicative DNA helicase
MGKTAFLTSLAMNISRQGIPVGVFSLEMAAEALVMRTLTGKAGVEMMRFRTGSTSEHENAKVFASADESYSLPIYYDDFSQQSVGRIRSVCRQWQRNHGVKVVFIDYLQLITPDLLRSSDNREREVAKISSGLKGLAKDLGIHVAALAQLSRKNETRADKRPVPSDLRDSGAIEQDADLILMLHRPEEFPGSTTLSGKHPQGIAEILISKHRNGPTGSVELYFDKQSMEFRNMYREPEYDEPQNVF